ncbi:MAG: UDP-N-acetylglucosamine--N-acetylmuramyl-(pentapeptide) pyrophosphoryl-undecaprenol N-acetylglucosamine transferase [Candidatus Omnitrophota bacterium]|nr:MAG: UDP-N-acetylglucosamine--N-acetylmuramyl-(pentapeptide) pyrophosphoryl-undecaprenol N-acetylglucosamine transferase [Candidatus Omnitrophota bacterium]
MRILIAAGGTGGHIFPAITLANKIKQTDSFADVIFCIDKRVDKKLLDKFGYSYYLLNAPRMPYGISFRWIPFLIILMFSFFKSAKILNEVAPDVAVGFGAYISGPLLAKARRQNKKIIIHEQNATMGRANRILSKISDKITISFANPEYLKDNRCLLTGNPIREELIEDLNALNRERAHRLLGLEADKMTILVMGGSLGSHIINTAFLQMLNNSSDKVLNSLCIIHLTGKDKFANVQSLYKNIDAGFHTGLNSFGTGARTRVKLYPFFERMGLLYKAADFAICRAGATTIAELCLFGVPAILIPYTGAGAHQIQNAKFLKEKGAAVMVGERQLTAEVLKKEVVSLLGNNEKLSAMSERANLLANIDAAEKLAEVVLKL